MKQQNLFSHFTSIKPNTQQDNLKQNSLKQTSNAKSKKPQHQLDESTNKKQSNLNKLADLDIDSGKQTKSLASVTNLSSKELSMKEEVELKQVQCDTKEVQKIISDQLLKFNNSNQNQEETQQIIPQKQESTVNQLVGQVSNETLEQIEKAMHNKQNAIKSEQINSKSKQSLQTQASTILQQPSLKMRYEELVKEQPEAMLPVKYKELLAFLTQVDSVMYLMKQRKGKVYWEELQKNCEQNLKIQLDNSKIKKIMFVYPESYVLQWEKTGSSYQLSIDFGKSNDLSLENRQKKFKNIITQRVQQLHNQFLKDIGNEDYMNTNGSIKMWHPQFQLQKVPDFQEAAFPEKPQLADLQSQLIQEGDSQADLKKKLLSQILVKGGQGEEALKNKQKQEQEKLLEYADKLNIGTNTSGLSDRLYKMIKAKEYKLKLEKEQQNKQENIIAARKEDLLTICDIIKLHYSMRQVSNMFMVQVIDKVYENLKGQLMLSPVKIEELLVALAAFCPEWITIVDNKDGKILRMNKTADYLSVKLKIQSQKLG